MKKAAMTELEKYTKALAKKIKSSKTGWSFDFGYWGAPQMTRHARVIDAKKGLIEVQLEDIWPLI